MSRRVARAREARAGRVPEGVARTAVGGGGARGGVDRGGGGVREKRNNPDSAELEDARRRGESIAAERAARDLEKRLREQRELFDGAVDRMRAAHAEAQAERRESSRRERLNSRPRAQYVASSADSTKEANRMVSDAQALIREAREKAELEKSNSSRMRAELNAAVEAQQRHKRALVDVKLELTRLREDFKFESESNAELRKALERRDEERNIMREQIERFTANNPRP